MATHCFTEYCAGLEPVARQPAETPGSKRYQPRNSPAQKLSLNGDLKRYKDVKY